MILARTLASAVYCAAVRVSAGVLLSVSVIDVSLVSVARLAKAALTLAMLSVMENDVTAAFACNPAAADTKAPVTTDPGEDGTSATLMVSPSARRVVRLTSNVVSQYCPGSVPHGLRISRSPVVLS